MSAYYNFNILVRSLFCFLLLTTQHRYFVLLHSKLVQLFAPCWTHFSKSLFSSFAVFSICISLFAIIRVQLLCLEHVFLLTTWHVIYVCSLYLHQFPPFCSSRAFSMSLLDIYMFPNGLEMLDVLETHRAVCGSLHCNYFLFCRKHSQQSISW